MASFLIKRVNKKKKIVVMEYENKGYVFKPNICMQNCEINKITVFHPLMIDAILSKKIEKQFKRVAAITYDVLMTDDDDDENGTADTIIALDEVSRLRNIILDKYQQFLDKEKEKMYIKKLRVLENQLREKMMIRNYKKEELEEIKGRGR